GVTSGLRAHSAARTMYGWRPPAETGGVNTNTNPFNGIGRLHAALNGALGDEYNLVNYTYFPADGKLHDPERAAWRTDPTQPQGQYFGANASYTYPDLNTLFLGAVRADGVLLSPSYHRPWLFNPTTGLNDASNPNWTN